MRDYDGKDHKPVRWRMLPTVSPYGWTDFGVFVRPAEQTCSYVTTFVRDPRVKDARHPRRVGVGGQRRARCASSGTARRSCATTSTATSTPTASPATSALRAGWNRLTAKVCGDERSPMLSLRVAAASGAPDPDLEVDADPKHSTRQGGAVMALGKGVVETDGRRGGARAGVREAGQAGRPGDARGVRALPGSDRIRRPTEHRARELARKAADKAPTVERLLLAGELAESRNQRADWIAKAEALGARGHATPEETIELLLARAAYARERA